MNFVFYLIISTSHERMCAPTGLLPIGLIGDAKGQALNVSRYRARFPTKAPPRIPVIAIFGTAMNSGYEWTAPRTLLDTAPEELPILLRGDVEVIARALLPWLRGPMESRDTVSECRTGRRRTGSLTPLRNGVSARPER